MRHIIVSALVLVATFVWVADTYADDGTWSVLNVTGTKPPARKEHTMVYDPVLNTVILYGGYDTAARNDLWILHLTGNPYWEKVNGAAHAPSALFGHSATWDPQNNRMFLLGGRNDTGTSPSSFQDGVRVLSWGGNKYNWDLLFDFPASFPEDYENACQATPSFCRRPFSRRTNAAAVALPGRLFMMGGEAASPLATMNDTWGDAFGADNWYYVSGSLWGGVQPCDSCIDFVAFPPRSHHTMIADQCVPFGRRVIFGGVQGTTPRANAYYAVGDATTWTYLGEVPTSPHNFSRESHAAVYDAKSGRMVVIGGYVRVDDEQPRTITGAVTSLPLPVTLPQFSQPSVNNNWVLHSTSGDDPGPMAEHAAAYDSDYNRVIVFGGVDDLSGTLRDNDVWVLTFQTETVTLSGQAGPLSSTITWTAPERAAQYDLRRSTAPLTEQNFQSAQQLATNAPLSPGSPECVTSSGLTPCQAYYYALKTMDDCGTISPMSNVLTHQKCSGSSFLCEGGGGPSPSAPSTPSTAPSFPAQIDFSIRSSNPAVGFTSLFVGVPKEREGETMTMEIYDVAGKRVRTLWSASARAGDHDVTWDHRDDAGAQVARGVYFARLRIGNETRAFKLVLPGRN